MYYTLREKLAFRPQDKRKRSASDQVPGTGVLDQSSDDVNTSVSGESDNDRGRNATTETKTGDGYPTGLRLFLVLSSVFISIFMVSLDRLIVTTAIPAITNEFNSLPDVGWYGSAYLLTSCAFQLLFGKLYSLYPIRGLFAGSVVLFETGSALCGAAPNTIAFIVGRAIQGIGSGGLFAGSFVVIVYAVPLAKRPLLQGMAGAIFGLSSILGPLVGGAFTSNVTWRWCFYINLPFGALALAIILLFLRIPERPETKLSTRDKLLQLDAAGTTVFIPGIVAFLLALQWGGLEYPVIHPLASQFLLFSYHVELTTTKWHDGRIIALLTLGVVLGAAFILAQGLMPATATIPPRVIKQRSIFAGFWLTAFLGAQQVIFIYFLPIYFQAIKGVSAVDSGIRLLPTTLSVVAASILNGLFVAAIGYYTPSALAGTVICSVGAGLLTTLGIGTPMGRWVGFQVLYGFGLGLCTQASNLVAQTVLPKRDVPIGISLMFFSQILGGAIFLSVGQTIFNNELLHRLRGVPGFSPDLIKRDGATDLINSFPPRYRHAVLVAYSEALRVVFRIGLVLVTVAVLAAACLECRSVKKENEGEREEVAAPSPEAATVVETGTGDGETGNEQPVAEVKSMPDAAAVVENGDDDGKEGPESEKPETEPIPDAVEVPASDSVETGDDNGKDQPDSEPPQTEAIPEIAQEPASDAVEAPPSPDKPAPES
ncbi:major facilitator superfamily domain-containing protein [Xylaria nigripes]|nr:major facilitator superfamily domain-containing protein [Xylaria nigripes]